MHEKQGEWKEEEETFHTITNLYLYSLKILQKNNEETEVNS